MAKISILLLDDTPDSVPRFSAFLAGEGFPAKTAGSPAEVFAALTDTPANIFLVYSGACADLLPCISQVARQYPDMPVVVLSLTPSVHEAVALTRAGAWEYPESPDDALQSVRILAKKRTSRNMKAAGRSVRGAGRDGGIGEIIGQSREMEVVFDLIEKVADTDSTVLVQGESGTGKELIAKALHYEGERHAGPFVPVNCGAIPGELLESELFGHEKGAFTHAVRTRVGRFELANSGTVFLDEIAEMSPMLQVKLLRVLQERQFERVGGTKTIHSDFRVIAATNRDLDEEVRNGNFREDLFYRLNVIQIEAPPLRQRVSDIPLLVDFFLKKYNQARKRKITGFSEESMRALQSYGWPGNVRELENVVERLVILAEGNQISLSDLPERFLNTENAGGAPRVTLSDEGLKLNEVVVDFEKEIIRQALQRTDWVKNRAAKLLHINRTTLIEKMKRYNMVKPA